MRHFIVSDYVALLYPGSGDYPGWGTSMGSSGRGLSNIEQGREFYRERYFTLPRNYHVANFGDNVHLRVVFTAVDHGSLLLSSTSLDKAYKAVRSVDAFFFLYCGCSANIERSQMKLTEVSKIPQPTWTLDTLANHIVTPNIVAPEIILGLYSGHGILRHEMETLGQWLQKLDQLPNMSNALAHLGYSQTLLNGFMTSSYYYFHYNRDRRERTYQEVKRLYWENRELYELAFISGFKGLESLFGTGQIKIYQIDKLLIDLNHPDIQPNSIYCRRHEIFVSRHKNSKKITFSDLIKHFLDVRNVVAAHSNPNPPPQFYLAEDTIFELQAFLSEICLILIGPLQPSPLSDKAYLQSVNS
jgi:hypothetical protein